MCVVRSECVWDLALQQALLKVTVHRSIRVSLSVPEGPVGNVTLGCLSAWHVPLVLLFECRWHVSSQSPWKATLVGVCGPSPASCVTCRATVRFPQAGPGHLLSRDFQVTLEQAMGHS